MKTTFAVVTLICLLVLGNHEVLAQAYGPSYAPYWDGDQYQQYAQQNDPYYQLHLMHYQLYLPQYPPYQVYQSCCFVVGAIPAWSAPIVTLPQVPIIPRARGVRRR